MSATDVLKFARAFPDAAIVLLHFEGWRHFSETRQEITAAFAAAGLEDRLRWIAIRAELRTPAPSQPSLARRLY